MKKGLANKFNKFIFLVKERGMLLYFIAKHPDTPVKIRIAIGLLFFYVIMPFDIIPDSILGVGIIDDILMWQLITTFVLKNVPLNVKDACLRQVQKKNNFFKKIIYIILLWILLMIISFSAIIWSLLR